MIQQPTNFEFRAQNKITRNAPLTSIYDKVEEGDKKKEEEEPEEEGFGSGSSDSDDDSYDLESNNESFDTKSWTDLINFGGTVEGLRSKKKTKKIKVKKPKKIKTKKKKSKKKYSPTPTPKSESSKLQDGLKKTYVKIVNNIKNTGGRVKDLVTHFPGLLNKNVQKESTAFTKAIYSVANMEPEQEELTKEQIKNMELSLRKSLDKQKVAEIVNKTTKKMTKLLKSYGNIYSINTKNNLLDDFRSLEYKILNTDTVSVRGDDAYNNLMLTINSIKLKLSNLQGIFNTKSIINTFNEIIQFKSRLESDSRSKKNASKKVHNLANEIISKINPYLKENDTILPINHVNNMLSLKKLLFNTSYSKNIKESVQEISNEMNNISQKFNTYYKFDVYINQLIEQAELFRFELRAKQSHKPKDTSKIDKAKEDDGKVIVKIVYIIMCIPLVILATYNWYYLIVYRDADKFYTKKPQNDNEVPRPYNVDTKIRWDFSAAGPLEAIIDYVLGFCIVPTRWLNILFLEDRYLPSKFSNDRALISRAVILLIFAPIIYYLLFAVSFSDLMKGKPNTSSSSSGSFIVYFAMTLIYWYYVYMMAFLVTGRGSQVPAYLSGFINSSPDGGKIPAITLPILDILRASVYIGIPVIILTLVIFWFISLLSINTSIMVMIVYIIMYSILGVYLYRSKNDDKTKDTGRFWFNNGYKETLLDLERVFRLEVESWLSREKCEGITIMGWIMTRFFGKIFSWFIAFIIMFCMYYSRTIKLPELKGFVIGLLIIVGAVLITLTMNWKELGPKLGLGTIFSFGFFGWILMDRIGGTFGIILGILYQGIKYLWNKYMNQKHTREKSAKSSSTTPTATSTDMPDTPTAMPTDTPTDMPDTSTTPPTDTPTATPTSEVPTQVELQQENQKLKDGNQKLEEGNETINKLMEEIQESNK